MIKIRRKEKMPPALCISYPCTGECPTSRALTERTRTEAVERAMEIADVKEREAALVEASKIELECPQKGSHLEQWRPDAQTKEFSVSAAIALAAVDSGFFEEVPESQAKLKDTTGDRRPPTEKKTGDGEPPTV